MASQARSGTLPAAAAAAAAARARARAPRAFGGSAALTWVYLAGGGVGIAVLHLTSGNVRSILWQVISASCVVAMAVGIRVHRPPVAAGWWFLAASQACWFLGDVVWTWYPQLLGVELPYPSWADALYLLGYPFALAGLGLMIRARGSDRHGGGWVDAALVTIGAAVLLWHFVFHEYAGASLGELSNVAYPVFDVLLLGLLARLLFAPGRRSVSFVLLTASLIATLVADLLYAVTSITGPAWVYDPLATFWLAGYVLLGAAALHPSVTRVLEPDATSTRRVTVPRLVILLALVIGPVAALLIFPQVDHGGEIELMVGASLIAVVAVLRMFGLGRQMQDQSERLTELTRQRGALLRQLTEAGENERRQLAAELHDGPIQHLARLQLTADHALARVDDETAHPLVEEIAQGVADEVFALRRIMVDLRPPILNESGLEAALRDELDRMAAGGDVAISLEASVAERPGAEGENALYRVAQEAVRNAVRHGRPSAVRVILRVDDLEARLTVHDDGRGFDPTRVDARGGIDHFGMIAMRERVGSLGGTLKVSSTPGRGTTVHAWIPSRVEAEVS